MSNFKKAFTITVSVLTVLWSAGFVFAPTGVSAASAAGDLIKMAGNPAVYYFDGSKRFVFPTESVYKSWYKDFSGVKTIPSSELASYLLGGNISIRPGTKLVKITTDPRVYAVEPGGMLRHISSEAIATALYGSNWTQRVVDVPDQFFANSYKYGTAITSNVHPTGSVIMVGSTYYYVDNGVKRPFASEAAMAANGIDKANAITTTIAYPDGSSVTAMDSAIWSVTGGATAYVPGGSGLTVALASDTPVSASVPKSGTNVKFLALNFTAGSDGAVILDGFTLRRMGVGSANNFSAVYVFDGANRLTSGRTVNSSSNEVTFTGFNLSIPAGSTKKLWVTSDIAASLTSGQTSNFVLEAASKVSTVTSGVNVSGSFPVTGNMMTFVDVTIGTLTVTTSGSLAAIKVGQSMAKVSEFKLAAATEDIQVSRITMNQGGSISRSNLSNLKLRLQGSATDLASVASVNSKDLVVFELATPYTITQGNDRIFEVYADVAANARTTDDVKLFVEETTDIAAVGMTYGYGVIISNGTFNASSEAHDVNVEGGKLTITFEGPTNFDTSRNVGDVVVYKFNMTAAQALEIRKMSFAIESPSEGDAGDDATGLINGDATSLNFQDFKVKDLDSGLIITASKELGTTDDDSTLNNAAPYTDDNPDQVQVISFTDYFTMNPGVTRHFALLTDIKDTNPANNDLKVYMLLDQAQTDFTAKSLDSSDFITDIVPSIDLAGNTVTVKLSSLTMGLASTPVSDTVVKRSSGVPTVGMTFQAGTSSDITVTSIKLTGYVDTNAAGAFTANTDLTTDVNDLITAVRLYEGDDMTKPLADAKSLSSDGTVTFSGLTWKILQGTTQKLVVRMDVSDSVATNNRVKFDIAANGDVTAQDKDSNSLTAGTNLTGATMNSTTVDAGTRITFAAAGALTGLRDSSTPNAGVVLAGTNNVLFTAVSFSATKEDFQVKKFNVTETNSAAAAISAIRVSYPGASGTVSAGPFTLDSAGVAGIDVSSNPMIVKKGATAVLSIYADVAPFVLTDGSESGRRPVINFDDPASTPGTGITFEAVGASSGTTLNDVDGVSADIAADTQIVYKSKPTVTFVSLPSITPTNGEMSIYKWSVTATGGSVAVKQTGLKITVTDNVGTNNTLTLGNFKLYRDSTDITTSVAIVDQGGADLEAATSFAEADTHAYVVFGSAAQGEESIAAGATYTYELKATAAGFATPADDDSFRVELLSDSSSTDKYLSDADATAAEFIATLSAAAGTGADALPQYFLWSDVSAIPHQFTLVDEDGSGPYASTSSGDWANSYLIKNLPLSQTSFVF